MTMRGAAPTLVCALIHPPASPYVWLGRSPSLARKRPPLSRWTSSSSVSSVSVSSGESSALTWPQNHYQDPPDDKDAVVSVSTADPTTTSTPTTITTTTPTITTTTTTVEERNTRYTITTPRTNPVTLRRLVEKHVLTLDRYLQSKPLAEHTSQAFATLYQQWQQEPFLLGKTNHNHNHTTSTNTCTSKPTRIILDSGCGTGRSSLYLGQQHPDAIVVGVDKSLARLSRRHSRPWTKAMTNHHYHQHQHHHQQHQHQHQPPPWTNPDGNNNNHNETTMLLRRVADNVWLVRAELVDFWRCWSQAAHHPALALDEHYLLYPNPYPKLEQVQRRWYAHPVFPLLLQLAGTKRLVVRSNWKIYLQEFAEATQLVEQIIMTVRERNHNDDNNNNDNNDDNNGTVRHSGPWRGPVTIQGPTRRIPTTSTALTNFEAKYDHVGEPTYELIIEWKTDDHDHDDDAVA